MSSNSKRFASLVIAAFEERALTTDELVKQAGGPSNTYMTNLRKAAEGKVEMTEPRSDTYRRIEVAANWRRGTARLVWRGEDPVTNPESRFDLLRKVAGEPTPQRRRFSDSLEGYVERIADRLTDLEERVEVLEQQIVTECAKRGDGNADDEVPATEPLPEGLREQRSKSDPLV